MAPCLHTPSLLKQKQLKQLQPPTLLQAEEVAPCLPDLAPCRTDQQCCSRSCRLWMPHPELAPRRVCLPKAHPTADSEPDFHHTRRLAADPEADAMPHGHRPCKRADEECSEHSECCSWLCVADRHGKKTCEPIPL